MNTKNIKDFLIDRLNLSNLEKEDQREVFERLINLSVNKTLDELAEEFDDAELEKIAGIENADESFDYMTQNHPEKIQKFNDVFNIKINETVNEFRSRNNG